MKPFYKHKRLLQAWVSTEDHAALVKLARAALLPTATYMRQMVHAHVRAARAAQGREAASPKNGARRSGGPRP